MRYIATPENRAVRDLASRELEVCEEMHTQLRNTNLPVDGHPIPKEVFVFQRIRELVDRSVINGGQNLLNLAAFFN